MTDFDIAPQTLTFWSGLTQAEHEIFGPFTPMTEADLTEIAAPYSTPLPQAYRDFMLQYGPVWFEEGKTPNRFTYLASSPASGIKEHMEGSIDGFHPAAAMRRAHLTYFAPTRGTPQNPDELPRLPADMLPMAADPMGALILLHVAPDPAGVFFWESSPHPWGHAQNNSLASLADDLPSFLAGLT
ncbi:SMI1/KNR4 family protein [Alphaproteobacteria bacterium KMM 3653]|uniref:SMI1/KNR4 family protein n=1 Tax=Harenicola maris TaxID=2841044 RepID=A0AAP2CQI5_9RHOB|nr:SMI1/KNR4 family protein [Harenicola maris]